MKTLATSSKSGIVFRYFITGLVVGVIARLWMRWIATDPAFTWSGSIFIIGAFTLFFTVQSLVLVLRRTDVSKRKSRTIRAFGIFLTLPLFTGAGGMMFPTVALASVALWSGLFHGKGKALLLLLSLVIPLRISINIISDFGFTITTLGRILLFVAIYTMVILMTRPSLYPTPKDIEEVKQPMSRRRKVTITAGVLFVVASTYLFTVGFPVG